MSVDIKTTYQYKISRSGVYLGLLPNVVSDFGYNQLINTAVAQLQIEVNMSADTASLAPSPILDETGDPILDENGVVITEESSPEIVGDASGSALIRCDNTIEVVEYSSYNPNGVTVFKGYIAKWKAVFGGDDNIIITCLNQGQDMANRIMTGLNANTVDRSQTSENDSAPIYDDGGGSIHYFRLAQTFTTGAGITNLSAVALRLAVNSGPKLFTVSIYRNLSDYYGGIAAIGTASQTVSNTLEAGPDTMFTFPSPISVSAATQYAMIITSNSSSAVPDLMYLRNDSDTYSGGEGWYSFEGRTSWNALETVGGVNVHYDFYFKTYYSTQTTIRTYTSADVSTGIVNDFMTDYISQGGLIAKQTGGYTATGTLATYAYRLATALEGIQTAYSLGPYNWYWYVDVALEQLIYKAAATTAEHLMIRGRHINELDIEATKEEIANIVYFSGGDDGSGHSTNVFVKTIDSTSLATDRPRIYRQSDNRVSGTNGVNTGTLLNQNYISGHNAQTYITNITILGSTYDISTFKLGQIVGFEGFGIFVDRLLLQIVGINRYPDYVVLSLGIIPLRQSQQIEDLQKQLLDAQTVANPNTPS